MLMDNIGLFGRFGASVFEAEYNGKQVDIVYEIDILFESIKKVFSHHR